MRKIAVLGTFAADTTYFANRLPKPGETLLGHDFKLGPGGKGSNQAVACAKLGADVSLITMLGEDAFAALALDTWKRWGVTPHARQDGTSHTSAAFIFVEPSGENAIIIAPGAAGKITPQYVEEHEPVIAAADLFVTQLEQPVNTATKGLALARNAGVKTILNPAPAAALPEGMLALCDYVTPNQTEAEALTGMAVRSIEDARAAANRLTQQGVRNAVITLGAGGAFFSGTEVSGHVAGFDVENVVETTGAGDAFNAGFAVGIAEGFKPLDAVRFGCAAAAISITRHGTTNAMPQRAEVEALLRRAG